METGDLDRKLNTNVGQEPPPSLDLAFEWVKGVLTSQSNAADSLETKAMNLFTLATAILGLGVSAGVLSSPNNIPLASILLGAASLMAYGFVIGYAFAAIRLRKFETLDNPIILRERYWDMNPVNFKMELLSHLEDSYQRNETKLNEKARATRWLIAATAAQVLFLVVALVLLW